jgi:hypothetical protein
MLSAFTAQNAFQINYAGCVDLLAGCIEPEYDTCVYLLCAAVGAMFCLILA